MMQLPNLTQPQSKTEVDQQLLNVLQDIAHNVEIQSHFCIRHPDYKLLELTDEAIDRFQKMPEQMQQKYLSLQLQNFLYGIYYNGAMRAALALDAEQSKPPLDLENNTVLGMDIAFYQRLHESNHGRGYFDSGWSVLQEEEDGSLAVTKGALRLHIQRDQHLPPSEQAAVVGDLVAIRMPKNQVQSGFYKAISDVGLGYLVKIDGQPAATVRIYFNVTPEGAPAIMAGLTQQLNQAKIPFSFKVLYNPKDYHRFDSGVLYFDRRNYEVIKEILQIIYGENERYFKSELPLFTMQLAPGLGLAEEPNQKFAERESFGMNRCQIVANGLLEAWQQGKNSPEERMSHILEQFAQFGIGLHRVHLNADSEEIDSSFTW